MAPGSTLSGGDSTLKGSVILAHQRLPINRQLRPFCLTQTSIGREHVCGIRTPATQVTRPRETDPMSGRIRMVLATLLLVCGCAPAVDVQPMLRDFDDYSKNLKTPDADEKALATLADGQKKRDQAAALAGKKESVPLAEAALADARLAMEVQRMKDSSHRADMCRLEVEEARTKWSEAVYVLEQTEEFTKQASSTSSKVEPKLKNETPALPETTLLPDTLAPSAMTDVPAKWNAWRQ